MDTIRRRTLSFNPSGLKPKAAKSVFASVSGASKVERKCPILMYRNGLESF